MLGIQSSFMSHILLYIGLNILILINLLLINMYNFISEVNRKLCLYYLFNYFMIVYYTKGNNYKESTSNIKNNVF